MSARRRIALVGDGAKLEVRAAAAQAAEWLHTRAEIVGPDLDGSLDLAALDCDLVLSLGGDGSLLRTARRMGRRQKPVAGINYGRLGFLADLSPEDWRVDLESILAAEIPTTPRMLLEARFVRASGAVEDLIALNDVVVSQASVQRLIEVALSIAGEEVATYRGDGLIVATPVGSTAHSLSAGGPIVHPELRALVITPICPHLLTNRPLVIGSTSVIGLRHATPAVEAALSIDGQETRPFGPGDSVQVTAAPFDLQLVLPPDWTYYRILRSKLGWGVSPQQQRTLS